MKRLARLLLIAALPEARGILFVDEKAIAAEPYPEIVSCH